MISNKGDSVSKKTGHPTLYSAEMQEKADDYLNNYSSYGDAIPSNCGLACVLGVAEKTIYNWSEKNPAFLQTLERIQTKQKNVTLNNGLTNTFQPTIAKLVLANHGFHDKQDIDQKTEMTYKVIKPDDNA
jgi:hypothetical protein